jgi:L,D-peptidoglycan transpeptidase YkuD (ErfK/YbiS/YcfS/YnhG family)
MVRAGTGLAVLAALLLTGCTSFNYEWKKAASQPAPADDLQGRWDGSWLSDVNGHNGRLRCIVTRKEDGTYRARFHATYQKVLTFGYTVPLSVHATNGVFYFSGQANLHWWAGGVYDYEGRAEGTNFFSTYRCKYDHGTFRMSRPQSNAAPKQAALATSTQVLVVTTGDWNAVPGVLRRFERTDEHSSWKRVGDPTPVVVGRNGLGWGRGLNEPANLPGPIKKEGDGKSPAGIFRLSSAFGVAEPGLTVGIRLPYQRLTSAIECVDDVKSVRYNSIVDRSGIGRPDWNSSEKMLAVGERYRLGVVVDHNTDPREPGGGSCIFLHIWENAKTGTSGCTAMAPARMEDLVTWLDPAAHPALVQLPQAEYAHLRDAWQLPAL